MKKTIAYVAIALHFATMKVVDLLPFAKGIRDKIALDPDIHIDPLVQTALTNQIKLLDDTVTLRKTDSSKTLTKKEGKQATDVAFTLEKIAATTEETANALTPGLVPSIQTIILRIGFQLRKAGDFAGRFFEVFKTEIATIFVRIKSDKTTNLYHWRWSLDEILWHRVSDSTVASIVIVNLPSKKTVFIQSATSVKVKGAPRIDANNNEPNWGDSISQLIP